jgi:hypothetical protein
MQYGGHVKVCSEIGQGTVIKICLLQPCGRDALALKVRQVFAARASNTTAG